MEQLLHIIWVVIFLIFSYFKGWLDWCLPGSLKHERSDYYTANEEWKPTEQLKEIKKPKE